MRPSMARSCRRLDDGGVVLVYTTFFALPGRELEFSSLMPGLGDGLASRQGGDVLEHGLAAITEAGAFTAQLGEVRAAC